MTVKKLHLVDNEPVPEVVDALRDALIRAERGEIIGVGIAMACTGRADGTSYAVGKGGIATLVLSCERLKMRLLSEGEPPTVDTEWRK